MFYFKHDLHSRDKGARNRGEGTPSGGAAPPSRRGHLFGKHDLHSRDIRARNRGAITPPWGV